MAKVYSVILTHEAEVHNNWLYTDIENAKAKVESIKNEWVKNGSIFDECFPFAIHEIKVDDGQTKHFGEQYAYQFGYWYENGEYEYGSITIVECDLDTLPFE